MMQQQRSSEQRSTVHSRRHLTNFKMLVNQSMSAVLRQSVKLMLNVKRSSPQSVLSNVSTVC